MFCVIIYVNWPFRLSCSDWLVTAVLLWLSCSNCPVRAVLSFLSCSGHPVQADLARLICQLDLSRSTCPGCPVWDVLSLLFRHGCTAVFVLCWSFCPSCPCPALGGLSWLSYHSVLSWLSCIFWPSCCIFPAMAVLPPLSCPSCPLQLAYLTCPFSVAFSALLSPSFPIRTVLSMLPCSTVLYICPDQAVLSSMPSFHVISVMCWAPCPLCLSSLSCPADFSGQPVQADISQLSCLDYPAPWIPCWLSCPSCHVPALSLLTCSGHPIFSVLSSDMIRLTFLANLCGQHGQT